MKFDEYGYFEYCIILEFHFNFIMCLFVYNNMAAFSPNTHRGEQQGAPDDTALFGSPSNTPCTLQDGIYEIRSHESSSGYLFKLMKIPHDKGKGKGKGEGIYSISAPDIDKLSQSYKYTPIGTPEIISSLIGSGYCIINGPGIDVGTTLISIEHVDGSTFYRLICDRSPSTGGRGSYKQLIHPRSCRGSRRGRGSRSRKN